MEIVPQSLLGLDKMEIHKEKTIKRDCCTSKKYVRLKHRIRLLDDIRKYDDSETRERAKPFIKRYEKRREKIKANIQKNKE